MEFNAVSIVKQAPETVWKTMRDRLEEVAAQLPEVESVRQEAWEELEAGLVRTVYIWETSPSIPAMVRQFLKPGMLAWTDTAVWNDTTRACTWRIDSHYFHDALDCHGHTYFEPALGGRGCRLRFTGSFQWVEGRNSSLGALSSLASKGLEPVLTQLISSNFRKIGKAVEGVR